MGKNQAYKAMQRARVGSSSAGPEEVDDGMVDGSFHSPEWHAARLASLKTSHTITWEEYKQKQKEDELRRGELDKETHNSMREYRAQLDKERALKLSQGRNHTSSSSSSSSKAKAKAKSKSKSKSKTKVKTKQKQKQKKTTTTTTKRTRDSDSDSDSTHSLRTKKQHKSTTTGDADADADGDGPLPLSRFFQTHNSSSSS